MAGMNSPAGVLNDAYGAFYAGGQRFFGWTNDAFNPTAWGVSTRMVPTSAPELLVNGPLGGGGGGMSNFMANVPTWSILQSPVPWVVAFLLLGIPLYHWYEYRK